MLGERYFAPLSVSLALALGVTACGGNKLKTSPAAYSRAYPGDPNAYGSDPFNWHEVIIANTKIQEPITDASLLVGFEVPGSDDWHESDLLPMDPTESSKILLRIGPGPVEFRVQVQAREGSKFIKDAPKTAFEGPEPYQKAITENPDVRVPPGWQSH